MRCSTARDLDYHTQRHHTEEGLAAKFESETKLAQFLQTKGVAFDRDWTNRLDFKRCSQMQVEGGALSARPDFFLPTLSAELGAQVLLGNDEFAHRRYPCDLQRVFNIGNALQNSPGCRDVPLLYVRFNPHFFYRDAVLHDRPLAESHRLLWKVLQTLKNYKLQPGVNLLFIQYDTCDGELELFSGPESEGNDFAKILRECVLGQF